MPRQRCPQGQPQMTGLRVRATPTALEEPAGGARRRTGALLKSSSPWFSMIVPCTSAPFPSLRCRLSCVAWQSGQRGARI